MPAPVPCWVPEGHEPGIWAPALVLCRVGPEEVLGGLILAPLRGAGCTGGFDISLLLGFPALLQLHGSEAAALVQPGL